MKENSSNKFWFVIPARKGSKRFPFKNRKLVPICLDSLLPEWIPNTIVSTNDSEIVKICESHNVTTHNRSEKNASDVASMRETMKEVIEDFHIPDEDFVVCLYPTYPERSFQNIIEGMNFIEKTGAESMLCKKNVKTHPYVCLVEADNHRATPAVDHDLYRWQDFPNCFQYSHFLIVFRASEVNKLYFQLFNNETVFMDIADVIDVDTLHDFEAFSSVMNR